MENKIKCPKCSSTQLTSDKKGFSGKKALAGAVLTGGIGLLAGTIGSGNLIISCLKCGNQFKPGDDLDAKNQKDIIARTKNDKIRNNPFFKALSIIVFGLLSIMFLIFIILFAFN